MREKRVNVTAGAGRLRVECQLHDEAGAVQFVFEIARDQPDPRWPSLPRFRVRPVDIGIHARSEVEATYHNDHCDVLDGGGECWYDGSGLAPEELLGKLTSEHGSIDDLWNTLEEWYADRLGPVPPPPPPTQGKRAE